MTANVDVSGAFEKRASSAPLPAAAADSNASCSLYDQWDKALAFGIFDDGVSSLSQLPDPRAFPDSFLISRRVERTYPATNLGIVLGFAVMKLYRATPIRPGDRVSLDPCGGWLIDVKESLGKLRRSYGELVGEACLMTLGVVLEMALNAPERLSILLQRIDALDNATLHKMSMDAVQGLDANADIFEGLYE